MRDHFLLIRISIGCCILFFLAAFDLHRNGARATRWKEYAFLILCVAAAMMYGILNDAITSSISWEYFCFGKGLWPDSVTNIPPDPLQLKIAAAKVGMQATWTAGLLIGAVLLIANNPSRQLPQVKILFIVGLAVAACGTIGGISGWFGVPRFFSKDFTQMWLRDEMRPRHFLAVFGVHLGGYIGGFIGTSVACILIRSERRKASPRGVARL